jgi:hypothetical protein
MSSFLEEKQVRTRWFPLIGKQNHYWFESTSLEKNYNKVIDVALDISLDICYEENGFYFLGALLACICEGCVKKNY